MNKRAKLSIAEWIMWAIISISALLLIAGIIKTFFWWRMKIDKWILATETIGILATVLIALKVMFLEPKCFSLLY